MGDYHGFYILLPRDNFSRIAQKISEFSGLRFHTDIVQRDPSNKRKNFSIRGSKNILDLPSIITEYAQNFALSHRHIFTNTLEFDYNGEFYWVQFDYHSDFALSFKSHWTARIELPWDSNRGRTFFIPAILEKDFMALVDLLEPSFGFAKVDYSLPLEHIKIPNFGEDGQLFDFLMRYRCSDKENDAKTFALPVNRFPFESLKHSKITTVGKTRFISDVFGFGNNLEPQQPVDKTFEIPYREYFEMLDGLRQQSKIGGQEIILALDIIEGRT
jgi:hypothetical protein